MLPNCGCRHKSSTRHKSSPDRQTWHMVKIIRNSFKAPKLQKPKQIPFTHFTHHEAFLMLLISSENFSLPENALVRMTSRIGGIKIKLIWSQLEFMMRKSPPGRARCDCSGMHHTVGNVLIVGKHQRFHHAFLESGAWVNSAKKTCRDTILLTKGFQNTGDDFYPARMFAEITIPGHDVTNSTCQSAAKASKKQGRATLAQPMGIP